MFYYLVLPFGLCNALATFQRAIINIFLDIFVDYMEIYMNDFNVYGATFEEARENLETSLKRC